MNESSNTKKSLILQAAREIGVQKWTPAEIDQYLSVFTIRRTREADGSIDHVTTSFLLGPDGRQIRQYDGIAVTPSTLADDIDRAISSG